MKLIVKSKPNSKLEKIELVKQPELLLRTPADRSSNAMPVYQVWVKEMPIHGQANAAIVKVLAKHFKVPQNAVRLVSGTKSKQKIFEIIK